MKKVLAILLILIMVMAVGCGTSESNTDDASEEKSQSVNEKETEKETEKDLVADIVKKVGEVEETQYEHAVTLFEDVVKKMREDEIVKDSDVCVTMDKESVTVDITFDSERADIKLVKDNNTNIYTLTLDYNFTWVDGLGDDINGKDPAPYNEELLKAVLGTVSTQPDVVFDRIDLDYYSAAGLSDTEWTAIGDCFIKTCEVVVDEYISYEITMEEG